MNQDQLSQLKQLLSELADVDTLILIYISDPKAKAKLDKYTKRKQEIENEIKDLKDL
jgi:cell division protein FtsB